MTSFFSRLLFTVTVIGLICLSEVSRAEDRGEGEWGKSFSIGIPLGLFNEDMHVGVDVAYPVTDNIVVRLNAPCVIDFYRYNELAWTGVKNKRAARPVFYPSLSFIGRTSLFHNLRLYGGVTGGIAYVNKGMPVMPHVEGFAGAEFIAQKHHAFFVEFGGGGVITPRAIDFGKGVIISGGTRFYF